MPYYNAALNGAVDGIAALGAWIAFHTQDPAGVSGANQTGSRVQTTWGAASAGSRVGSQVSASIGAGVTVTHWSVSTASTAGTILYSDALATPETFGAAGVLNFTPSLTATN